MTQLTIRSIGVLLGTWLILGLSAGSRAAAVPVTIECTSLLSIQTYNLGENATDQAYLLVSGQHSGQAIDERLPKDKAWEAAPKHPAVTDKSPVQLWKGELNDGEFVLLTVTLMQGNGQDAARAKQFIDKLNAADQQTPDWKKKTLASPKELTQLAESVLKANQSVIKKIKDIFSREKNTDHYGGQFTVIVWNNGGKLVKRLDPVGLTFGEHNGNDVKIYSKLKNTRNNVLVQDQGQWQEEQMEPLNDDQNAVRVKELETEYVKVPNSKSPVRHVTDYLVEIQVIGPDQKPLGWNLGGDVPGIDTIHMYWNFAQ